MRRLPWVVPMMAGALIIVGVGCAKKDTSETEKKLAEMQKQLDDTKKALEAAQPSGTAPSSASTPAAATPGSGPAAPGTGLSSQVAQNKSDIATNKSDIATNKAGIEKNRTDIATNKDAIATNKGNIEKNAANIETNRQGVEEAKKMAAPAPYHTLAVGTPITARTTGAISTKSAATGSLFEATLDQPLEIDGYLVAPKGATVEGIVVSSDQGGRVKGVASIRIGLRSVMMADGRRLPIKTSSVEFDANKSGKKDALKVGIASGVGAAIGAIAGGGKGAAIGAGAGAAGGTGLVLGTKGEAAQIPAESVVKVTLTADAKFQELKK